MNYELHYAPLELNGDIEKFETKVYNNLVDAVKQRMCYDLMDVVFLLAFEPENKKYAEIVITENLSFIVELFEGGLFGDLDLSIDVQRVFIQEYKSYEEAYKVALNMKEESPLCYSE